MKGRNAIIAGGIVMGIIFAMIGSLIQDPVWLKWVLILIGLAALTLWPLFV